MLKLAFFGVKSQKYEVHPFHLSRAILCWIFTNFFFQITLGWVDLCEICVAMDSYNVIMLLRMMWLFIGCRKNVFSLCSECAFYRPCFKTKSNIHSRFFLSLLDSYPGLIGPWWWGDWCGFGWPKWPMGISIEIISPAGLALRVNVGKLGMALSVSGSVFQAGNSTVMRKPP